MKYTKYHYTIPRKKWLARKGEIVCIIAEERIHLRSWFYLMENALQPDRCASRLQALADPLRLRIVGALLHGTLNVSALVTQLDVPIVTLSHHLGVLRRFGIVEGERQGRYIVYRLADGVYQRRSASGPLCLDLGCCRVCWPDAEA
jgi:DNA-binding transcriptional ArsR family regulator